MNSARFNINSTQNICLPTIPVDVRFLNYREAPYPQINKIPNHKQQTQQRLHHYASTHSNPMQSSLIYDKQHQPVPGRTEKTIVNPSTRSTVYCEPTQTDNSPRQNLTSSLTLMPPPQSTNKQLNVTTSTVANHKSQGKDDAKNKNPTNQRNVNEKIRIFTGNIDKIIKWNRTYKEHFCYYEVIGAIVSIQEGSVRLQKILLLRDKKGPILQIVHYVNDHICIENFCVGQMLRCVGRMIGPSTMHGLSIREAKDEEIAALQRMCYVSDHAISKSFLKF